MIPPMDQMQYPFFSHLPLAQEYWKKILRPGDEVVDATLGNGKDTLILSKIVLQGPMGRVIGLDIQEEAISMAKRLLESSLTEQQLENVQLLKHSHADLPSLPTLSRLKLFVYNLGYLPGGDKHLTTLTSTTLVSIRQAMEILPAGGFISITCYPGHPEGAVEEESLLALCKGLPSHLWNICYHTWPNKIKSPTYFLIQKK